MPNGHPSHNPGPADAPLAVMPQPVDTVVTTALVPDDAEGRLVAIQFQTPVGVAIYFVSQDTARSVGVELQKLGSMGRLTITK